jgi:FkbM family methyltransferase
MANYESKGLGFESRWAHMKVFNFWTYIKTLWTYLPIAKPFPLSSFKDRTNFKFINIKWRSIYLHKWISIGLIQNLSFEFCEIKLKRNTVLGQKNDVIKVPRDGYIDLRIKVNGLWDLETTKFFSRKMQPKSIFLDIGGHAGLISRQVYHLSESKPGIYIVEPSPLNIECIKSNLSLISKNNSVTILEKAISATATGPAHLFTQIGATMNSSLNKEITTANGLNPTKIQVDTIYADEFCNGFLASSENKAIALKCDIQGDDVKVLSNFHSDFWNKVYIGTIELYSGVTSNRSELILLLEHLSQFDRISFDSDLINQASNAQIMDFYLSKKCTAKNIYFLKVRKP